ncbi:DUF5704 domain-containing protein, partial [Streptomyces diastaticus]
MKKHNLIKLVLLIFVLTFIIELIPIGGSSSTVKAATPPMSKLGGDWSYINPIVSPSFWANGTNATFSGGLYIPKHINDSRAQWHSQRTSQQQIVVGYDSETAYTPPNGWEIHSILRYPVYKIRTYPLSKADCGGNAGVGGGQGDCHPYTFHPERVENQWALSPQIVSKNHWQFYGEENFYNDGFIYYMFRAAQIRTTGGPSSLPEASPGSREWYKYDFKIQPIATTPPTDPPPVGGSCPYVIGSPSVTSTMAGSDMSPNSSGSISAESVYNVTQGIPTSEYLRADGSSDQYLFQHSFQQKSGNVTYTVQVQKTYNLTWTEKTTKEPIVETPKTEQQTVTKTYTITRPYSYWDIANLEIYKFDSATFSNYALPGESVTIPSGVFISANATNDPSTNSHVVPAECENLTMPPQTVTGGDKKPAVPNEDFKSQAEAKVGQNKVRNDHVTFQGTTIMNNSWTTTNGPTPGSIPNPSLVSVSERNMQISNTKLNRANTPSTGTSLYSEVVNIKGSGGTRNYPFSVNPVTVHTPTVIYADVSDDKAHNQRTTPDPSRNAVILDRPFTIDMPTMGQHLNIPGYGSRDYAKYIRKKEVLFPFDVWHYNGGNKGQFVPANTWIDIPVGETKSTFYLPVWVNEGNYNVSFRSIAVNSPNSGFTTQPNANTHLNNHVATDSIPIDVIGRLYDFRITDIADFNWETVFRERKRSTIHTGNYYWTGDKGIDGELRGNTSPFLLPVMPGKHPQYKNASVKTGYSFRFDVKTKGNMFNEGDAVRITPTFYFVEKGGSNRQEVDLYYATKDNPFVKIGSPEDVEKRYVILNDRLSNVPQDHIINAATYAFQHYSNVNSTIESKYVEQYLDESQKKTWIGKYDWLLLPYKTKTHIGPSALPSGASVQPVRATASIQQWYGQYSLPAQVKVVPKGTQIYEFGRKNKLTDKSPLFLKDGYIIVN